MKINYLYYVNDTNVMHMNSEFNKSEIAYIYYRHKHRNRDYDKEQARKQFNQDKNIDYKLLIKIIKLVCREQIKQFKNLVH